VARSAPDPEAPVSLAQNTFSAGEVSPGFYGRQDVAKYAAGCAVMHNFYVDARGGASVRPGTQFIGFPATVGYARLIPWVFSPDAGQSYVLVFSPGKLRFVRNPGTPCYPNGSNAGFVGTAGVPYEIDTPYLSEADLRALHYTQMADVMWLACRGHPRKKLSRHAETDWRLEDIASTPSIAAPTMVSITVSAAPTGVTPAPPVATRYMYAVSAVGSDGAESLPSVPLVSDAGINIATTLGTVSLLWSAVAGAQYYKVWKALPSHSDTVPLPSEQFGFAGFSYGTSFTDSNIVADFTKAPIQPGDPFAPGKLTGYTITAPGSGYVPGDTAIVVSDTTGAGAVVHPVLDTNIATATGGIVGLYIAHRGSGYTAPTATAAGAGTGFSATFSVGASSGLDPSAVALFQQRLVYASTDNKPNSIFASRPGSPDDHRTSNPVVENDAFELELFDTQASRIHWMRSMPGGLLLGTNSGVVQLTGGSASTGNPTAVTPTNAVVVPQSFYGSRDIRPVVVDNNIMFVQREGLIRDLQFDVFSNSYKGTDVTVLSEHLFAGRGVADWAWQDVPTKILWCILDDGALVSMTYLRSQEVIGWARHETPGIWESIVAIQEGATSAVYASIVRFGSRHIERLATQVYNQDSDAWQLDSALSITSNYPAAALQMAQGVGWGVLAQTTANVFTVGDVGKHINAAGSRAEITSVIAGNQAYVAITREFPAQPGTGVPYPIPQGSWRMDPVVSTVSGLDHLDGVTVYALVDGVLQGPFTVGAGAVALSAPGSQVVVGRIFQARLQPLHVEAPGQGTIQGKRKKVAAASIRLRNAKALSYGSSFDKLIPWRAGYHSTDEQPVLPYSAAGLFSGDQRLWLDQVFGLGGWVCIEAGGGYPATILSIHPELAQGDVI
jgi:hypothetical protein